MGNNPATYSGQGMSVSISADGNTIATGGTSDSAGRGSTWVFTKTTAGWQQLGDKLIGTGSSRVADQGSAVALSYDGKTLAVGGRGNSNATGATWVFSGLLNAMSIFKEPESSRTFWPNPVTDKITISGGTKGGLCRILDNQGRIVYTASYEPLKPINLSWLTPGTYFIQIDGQPARPMTRL